MRSIAVRVGILLFLGSLCAAPTCGDGGGDAPKTWGVVPATQVAVGSIHACALLDTGGVKCWGSNIGGQLGDGTLTERDRPVDVIDPDDPQGLLTGVVDLAAGSNDTCALLSDGHVKCWGSNYDLVLGVGADVEAGSVPLYVQDPASEDGLLGDVVQIAVGDMHACALTAAGGVKCWGHNYQGQLGTGDAPTEHELPTDVVDLAAGAYELSGGPYDTCAILEDHTTWCWGTNARWAFGLPEIAGRDDFPGPYDSDVPIYATGSLLAEVAVGNGHYCYLPPGGLLGCVGLNGTGQLGNGTFDDTDTPTLVAAPEDATSLGYVSDVAAGDFFTCALAEAGPLYCWGEGDSAGGQPNGDNQLIPAAVEGLDASNVVGMSAGGYSACALISDGSVRCWGANDSGQLGNGTTTDRHAPDTPVLGIGPAE